MGYHRPSVSRLGKYRLLEPVATGGMAEVYRAELPGPEGFVKQVAVKLLRGDLGDDPEMNRMFIQEARLASRLHHANIVHVFDFERVGDRYLLAMEYVHGRTLRQVADRCRETGLRLGLARSVHVALAVARALAYAHRPVEQGGVAGLVHRDVSPQNILVSFEGEVKLADFGIARAQGAGGLTEPGTVKGKAGYMAPEQAAGRALDARADVFALGVVLWELCTGRRLFQRESEEATRAAVASAEPISRPSEWNEEVPAELDAAVMAALQRDPGRRTPGAEELAAALEALLPRLSGSPQELALRPLMQRLWPGESRPPEARSGETIVRGAAPVPEPAGSAPGAEETTRAVRRPAGRWAAAAAAAVAILVAALALRPASPPGPAPGAAAGEGRGPEAKPAAAPVLPEPPSPAPPSPAPPASPATVAGPGPAPPLPRAESNRLFALSVPAPGSGEGILSLNATPWATVYVEGRRIGDTPRELRLPAGRYRVRLVHPTLGEVEQSIEVSPGARRRWEPALSR